MDPVGLPVLPRERKCVILQTNVSYEPICWILPSPYLGACTRPEAGLLSGGSYILFTKTEA